MSKFTRFVTISIISVLVLSACNLPSGGADTPNPNAIFTAAAQTVEAQLTQTVPLATATFPVVQVTNTPVPTFTSVPFTSAPPTATAMCDLAQFIKDVNIPDGTVFNAGDSFTKTWRLKNIGTCTWSGYSLVFDSGDSMNGPSPTAIGTVSPGQEVDLAITLKAPANPGTYRGYWRIRNGSGVLVPVAGGYQGKSFYVEIKVPGSSGYDFHTRAPSAQWLSCGSPCGGATTLTFGGPDTDTNGFVMYRNGAELENGSTPTKVLETHPFWADDGVISGEYSTYTVFNGDHFTAKIGFLAKPDGTCGTGDATFQLNYKESGTLKPLGTWTKACDGTLKNIDVDLSSLAGKQVNFVLAVLAHGSSAQDWAVWVNPEVQPAP